MVKYLRWPVTSLLLLSLVPSAVAMASDDPRRERAVPVGTAHAFVFPHHNRPGTIHAEDVESSGYSWVRYATPADPPNYFTGKEGNHRTVGTGVTVARTDAAA